MNSFILSPCDTQRSYPEVAAISIVAA